MLIGYSGVGVFTVLVYLMGIEYPLRVRDMAMLQGVWTLVSDKLGNKELTGFEETCNLVIKGNTFDHVYLVAAESTYTIDPTVSPKVMHLVSYGTRLSSFHTRMSMTYEVTIDHLKLTDRDGKSYLLFKRELNKP